MAVKRVWEDALKEVDAAQGGAAAKPMSAAVKSNISAKLEVPISTVEAAMKRYKRAIRRVREAEVSARVKRLTSSSPRAG
jgi:hypothetical protein